MLSNSYLLRKVSYKRKIFSTLSTLQSHLKKAPNLKVMMVDMNTAPIEKGSYREEFVNYLINEYPNIYSTFDAYCPEQQKSDNKGRYGELYIVGQNKKLRYIVRFEEDNPEFTQWYVEQLVEVIRE